MKVSAEIKALEEKLGHTFQDKSLLRRAVTHASMSGPGREDNQDCWRPRCRFQSMILAGTGLRNGRGAEVACFALCRFVRVDSCNMWRLKCE